MLKSARVINTPHTGYHLIIFLEPSMPLLQFPPGLPAFLSRGIKPRRIYYQIEVPLVSPPFTFSIAQFTRAGIIKFSLL